MSTKLGDAQAPQGTAPDDYLVLVSADTHVGPRLVEDLRPFCDRKYLEEFDAFAAQAPGMPVVGRELKAAFDWNAQTEGHYDPEARLRDMDADGVAAEIVFHGSQNFIPLPFDTGTLFGNIESMSGVDFELLAQGRHIYNRWLAGLCSVQPDRHVGLAQLPIWDIEASIAEVKWAAGAGLKGINFPAADGPGMAPLDDPEFEEFYAVCADLNMPLTTHVSQAPPGHRYHKSPYGGPLGLLDAGWWCRRSMMILTFIGAFERYPNLKLVLTEHPGSWYLSTLEEMDSMYYYIQSRPLRKSLPKQPSEYVRSNIWVGASFQSRQEAVEAVEGGFPDRMMWGSDYPHAEGTWSFPQDSDQVPMTHLSLASTYHDLPAADVRKMVGENAVVCYSSLDMSKLRAITAKINAPRLSQVAGPPADPETPHKTRNLSMAFRERGAWA